MGLLSSLLGGDMSGAGSAGLGILGQLGQGFRIIPARCWALPGGGPEGMIQGKRSDMLAAQQRAEQADKAKKIQAAQMMAQELKLPPELAQNPEGCQPALFAHQAAQMTPQDPATYRIC
jgi:hypothetical protein